MFHYIGRSGAILVTLILCDRFATDEGSILASTDEARIKNIEKVPLNQLKDKVWKNLTEEYMRKDVYLIKWLRVKQLNVKDAAKMILEMIEWRKEYKMDNILEEDFSDFIRDFPFTMDAVDLEGRPVGAADISDWDVRKITLTGRRDRAIRFVYRMAEIAVRRVMEAYDNGYNVTTGTILVNLNGFNNIQHGCSQCIPVYRNLIIGLESYYPGILHKLIAINARLSFYPIFQVLVPFLTKPTRDSIRVYGTDKSEWQPVILSMISPDEIEPQFGGTKDRPPR